jgi:hypothetical protein
VSRRDVEAVAGKRRCFCGKSAFGKHDLARDPTLSAWRRCCGVPCRKIVQRSIGAFPVCGEVEGAFEGSGEAALAVGAK